MPLSAISAPVGFVMNVIVYKLALEGAMVCSDEPVDL